CVKGVIYW
nr:immunoglobulin heavy chain junction region [Macaca mulatta]MOV57402.1 immunoglobulin heavy chain junction region [Macaca mulatta]MOV58307.1 immunoglobulin heavy chain junction region [Macaca mulatta]